MKNQNHQLLLLRLLRTEVVGSSCYQKHIGAEFTHLYVASLCQETIVILHNPGQSTY